jgi:hypothetical protein
MGNQEWTIRSTGNIGHKRHRTKTNKTQHNSENYKDGQL